MNKNLSSILASLNKLNNYGQNEIPEDKNNINTSTNKNSQKIIPGNAEVEEYDEFDNLGYKKTKTNNNFNYNFNKRLDSSELPYQDKFKLSIDMPNVPKQRLHDFLNEDLLNALEHSPNLPNLNSDVEKMKNNNLQNNTNNPNSLFGFSLHQTNNNNNDNKTGTINNFDFYNNQNSGYDLINNHNINNNINYFHNNLNVNAYNNKNNSNVINNIMENKDVINQSSYIPIKMRTNTQKNYMEELNCDKNNKGFKTKDEENNPKIKFDNKKNNNFKKESKLKKHFEVRLGDWKCIKCNNLNFSFRTICNRCGLPKEITEQQKNLIFSNEMYNPNLGHPILGNNINQNPMYRQTFNQINEEQFYRK